MMSLVLAGDIHITVQGNMRQRMGNQSNPIDRCWKKEARLILYGCKTTRGGEVG